MARKTGPAESPASVVVGPKLAGLTFVIQGDLKNREPEEVVRLIEAEGGRVVEKVAAGVDYLVVGRPKRGHPSDAMERARKLHKSLGEALRIVDDSDFHRLFQPTRDEAIALLFVGPEGRARWKEWTLNLYDCDDDDGLDLSGVDFRGADLRGVDLDCARLEGNDFSGADLSGGRFLSAVNCKFDGATLRKASVARVRDCSFRNADLREGSIHHAEGCTFDGARISEGYYSDACPRNSARGVDLSDAHLNPAILSGSDFTGSKLCRVFAGYTRAEDAIFRDADLSEAQFEDSHFERSDFTGANLGQARLRKCNFTGAILHGARLAGADLRGAILVDADLREADLRGAILADADLRGASIAGADFEGANIFKARLECPDAEQARNLERDQDPPDATPGPRLRELAKVARSSTELKTWARLVLPDEASVSLSVSSRRDTKGQHLHARYWHTQGESSRSDFINPPKFERGLLYLAKFWPKGQLQADGIQVEARKCPLRGAALLELATAAWREGLGLPALSTEEFHRQLEAKEAAEKALREELMAELRGGPDGIEAWNARPSEQRQKVGPLRKVDLSGADLAGADLSSMDLAEVRLDGARLVGADLQRSDLKGASLREADLTDASCSQCKGTRANFEGATLVRCHLGWASLLRSDLRNADLEAAHLSRTDLRGADLSGAELTGADLAGTRYDDQTRWPSGFEPPATMRRTGPAKPRRRRSP